MVFWCSACEGEDAVNQRLCIFCRYQKGRERTVVLPAEYGSQWKRAANPSNFCHNEQEPMNMFIELCCTTHVTMPRTASSEDPHHSAPSSALLEDIELLIAENEKNQSSLIANDQKSYIFWTQETVLQQH